MQDVDLKKIAAEILTLEAETRNNQIRIARLLCRARAAFPSAFEWTVWAHKTFRYARRDCFRAAAVVTFLAETEGKVRAAHSQTIEAQRFCFIDVLSALPVERVDEFLDACDITTMTRDELRDAVNRFLGREGREADGQLTFLDYRRLPDPERLTWGLENPRTIAALDYDREVLYVDAHIKRLSLAATHQDVDLDKLRRLQFFFAANAHEVQKRIAELEGKP
jgi:hypothetical protein